MPCDTEPFDPPFDEDPSFFACDDDVVDELSVLPDLFEESFPSDDEPSRDVDFELSPGAGDAGDAEVFGVLDVFLSDEMLVDIET